MNTRPRILLVEDDTNLGFLLVDYLELNNFQVKLYIDGESGFNAYNNHNFDFVILDVMLPKIDGFELAEKIKNENPGALILMLTARASDEDKIRGFNLGIDDYLTKPFNEVELVCRINAILTRAGMALPSDADENVTFDIGTYCFNWKDRTLEVQNEQRRLTKTESDILRLLCKSKNKVVSRKIIMEQVWGEDDYFVGRSLDVFVSKIRKYLAQDSSVKIETIPKLGLVLNA